MSYRTFKHLLGETSLERKCRFIFGGGIFALVTTSFYLYGQKTEAADGQTTQTARRLVNPTIMDKHYKSTELSAPRRPTMFEQLADSFKQQDDLPEYEGRIIDPYPKDKTPDDEKPRDAFERTPWSISSAPPRPRNGPSKKPYTFADGTSMEEAGSSRARPNTSTPRPSCTSRNASTATSPLVPDARPAASSSTIKAGDLACVAVIHLPMEQINKDINQNRAILISAALVTAIVAMVASYAIVRYVIVKPVKHLRDVSDAIAAGKLNDPRPDPDRRRVRGALARLQPDAPQPRRDAAGTPRRSTATSTARSTSWPRPTSPSSR